MKISRNSIVVGPNIIDEYKKTPYEVNAELLDPVGNEVDQKLKIAILRSKRVAES